MIEPLSLGLGAGLLGVGMLIGRAMRVKPPKPKPIQPVCSCGHGYGQHQDGGRCGAEVKRATRWGSGQYDPIDFEYVPCSCLKHDGPVPLPEVWAP